MSGSLKKCSPGVGNLLMAVVNSTSCGRQKQWELQAALSWSAGVLADVYKSCYMPKTSRVQDVNGEKSRRSVGNECKKSHSEPQWF